MNPTLGYLFIWSVLGVIGLAGTPIPKTFWGALILAIICGPIVWLAIAFHYIRDYIKGE